MKLISPLRILVGSFALLATAALPAQAGEWMVDYAAAVEKAKAEKKPILINFTGSDWCGWCVKMDEETFSKPAFQELAAQRLVLLEVDFPRNKSQPPKLKKQNKELQEKFNVKGFPTFVVINPNGKVLAEQSGYIPGGPEGLRNWLKSALQ